jgi:hypothetical protein
MLITDLFIITPRRNNPKVHEKYKIHHSFQDSGKKKRITAVCSNRNNFTGKMLSKRTETQKEYI